jgi:CheY-like chemotaxis protein
MSTKMLLVHTSKLIRKTLTSYANSELSDVVVEVASTPEEGLGMLNDQTYDIIVSGLEMPGLDGFSLHERLRTAEGPNHVTPFVILTSTDTPAQRERLARHGIAHYMATARAREDLARVVMEACNPRENRAHIRYNIPGAVAVLYTNGDEVTTKVINVCLSGILCEQTCANPVLECLGPGRMDVIFPEDYGNARAVGISTQVLRLNIMSWDRDRRPNLVRVARKFTDVPEEAWGIMFAAFDKTDREMAIATEELSRETS